MSLDTHAARIASLRAGFDQAAGRFLARFDSATETEATTVPASGGWTAAQIAAHVAALNRLLASVVSGRGGRPVPAPADFAERPWPEIAAELAGPLVAPASVTAPVTVSRAEALEALATSRALVLEAYAALDETRARHVFTDPRTGSISLYQIAEWLTAHVARHNAQLKVVLGR